jgi:hypothetical protein
MLPDMDAAMEHNVAKGLRTNLARRPHSPENRISKLGAPGRKLAGKRATSLFLKHSGHAKI